MFKKIIAEILQHALNENKSLNKSEKTFINKNIIYYLLLHITVFKGDNFQFISRVVPLKSNMAIRQTLEF